MVFSWDARDDIDNEILTKNVLYRRFTNAVNDLAYETYDRTIFKDYFIKAQCTIQRFDSKYVQEGILKEGDLAVFFRYNYTKDNIGNPILPILTPKKGDMIKFLGFWFVLKDCMPLTGEDDGIIGWDCTAGHTNVD